MHSRASGLKQLRQEVNFQKHEQFTWEEWVWVIDILPRKRHPAQLSLRVLLHQGCGCARDTVNSPG